MSYSINYKKELDFFIQTLEYNRIPHHKGNPLDLFTYDIDLGIRKALGLTEPFSYIKKIFESETLKQSIIYITDEFYCHYILLILPDTSPSEILIVGPYFTNNDTENIAIFFEKTAIAPTRLSILKNYYTKISCLPNEDGINAIIYALADSIWGKSNYNVELFTKGVSESTLALSTPPDSQYRLNFLSNKDLIERFYAQENALMHAIASGQVARAKNILNNLPLLNFKKTDDHLQNIKVFSIALNTLFRKAAEHNGVPPLYLEQLSSTMLDLIWTITRSDNVLDLWNDMIQKYCSLVNNNSTRNYSLPIKKVIIKINLDLSADLSLKAMSEYLNVNASYLSNLFRKETGFTITNYVNTKRMEYASFLLSTTPLPISTIAQHCGILDDNYFTKIFKKQYQLTPTQFRESVGKHDFSK